MPFTTFELIDSHHVIGDVSSMRKLFILAGYRGSGKTWHLNRVRERETLVFGSHSLDAQQALRKGGEMYKSGDYRFSPNGHINLERFFLEDQKNSPELPDFLVGHLDLVSLVVNPDGKNTPIDFADFFGSDSQVDSRLEKFFRREIFLKYEQIHISTLVSTWEMCRTNYLNRAKTNRLRHFDLRTPFVRGVIEFTVSGLSLGRRRNRLMRRRLTWGPMLGPKLHSSIYTAWFKSLRGLNQTTNIVLPVYSGNPDVYVLDSSE